MADIWQYFQNLFQKAEQSSKTVPLLHDQIIRREEEITAYEKWKMSHVKNQLINWVEKAYGQFINEGAAVDKSIIFLDTNSSKGLAIYFSNMRYTPQEATHLFDFLKEKVLELNYRSANADIRTYTKGTVVESLAKYYLKPSLKNMLGNPPFNQEFGNISIELVCQDDLPKILKFSATSYNDRSYQKPKHFSQLMTHLFKIE